MKSFKFLSIGIAIAIVSVTASKSFGSPGEHKELVPTEVTVKSDHLNFNLVSPEVFNPLISVEMIKKTSEHPFWAWPNKLDKEVNEALIAKLTEKNIDFEKEVLCSPHLGDAIDSVIMGRATGKTEKLSRNSKNLDFGVGIKFSRRSKN